jgi:hypothetical protein
MTMIWLKSQNKFVNSKCASYFRGAFAEIVVSVLSVCLSHISQPL